MPPIGKVLIFLTSSYPFGEGETFVDTEVPYLASSFQHIVIVSNDTESEVIRYVPPNVSYRRHSYELSAWEKLFSLTGLLDPAVWREMRAVTSDYGLGPSRRVLATILVSWYKSRKFSRLIRRLAEQHPGAEVHVYSYWANDMAVAAAAARRRGWIHRAYCRAHGWDVYFDRAEAGILPFRRLLAKHLDHYMFISEHGLRYFEERDGGGPRSSLQCIRLGVPSLASSPIARLHPFTILSCSQVIPLKRVDLIARALHEVATEVRWVHVGDGPELDTVRRACEGLPPNVRVDLKGRLANDEVLALYPVLRPSLFINVSETEGLPVSMMEAMSAGVPVMGTDVGGVREIVASGLNGVLLPPDSSAPDIAAAIDAFAALSDSEYAQYAGRAYATWQAEFNADTNYQRFLRVVQA